MAQNQGQSQSPDRYATLDRDELDAELAGRPDLTVAPDASDDEVRQQLREHDQQQQQGQAGQ